MRISECFASLQGEGTHIGIPSIFVRFTNCNLRCSWCDTKYSWNEPGKYSLQDVIKFIKEKPVYNHIVFTGGEPLLFDNQEDTINIIQNVMTVDSRITIETNGTIFPDRDLQLIMKNYGLWSVSPKLQYIDSYQYSMNTLHEFDSMKNIQWKFVITDVESDITKVIKLLETKVISTTIDRPIILQPNGYAPNYHTACRELAEYIVDNNMTEFRVLPQFHKICWGNKRGI